MDRLGVNKYYSETIEICARLYEMLERYNIVYPINFGEIIKNVVFDTKISELPKYLDIHIKNLRGILNCAKEYEKLKEYGGKYLINFTDIMKKINLNKQVVNLSDDLRWEATSIRRSRLAYEYPNLSWIILIFILMCYVSYKIHNNSRWKKLENVSLYSMLILGVYITGYAAIRFDIQS